MSAQRVALSDCDARIALIADDGTSFGSSPATRTAAQAGEAGALG